MKIQKVYKGLNPELLYSVVKDFVQKQGAVIAEEKLDTYSLPSDSSSFITRGVLKFKSKAGQGKPESECLRAYILGSVKSEVKLMLDIDEELFPEEKISALQDDMAFIFGSYE